MFVCLSFAAENRLMQAGPCCSLSYNVDASVRRFLVSTRGSSASHNIFSLEASTLDTAEHSGVGVDDTAEQRDGLVSERSSERSSWMQRWKKLPGVAQVSS